MVELTLVIASHFFKVIRINPRARPAVEAFAKKYVQYGLQQVGRGKFARMPIRTFAASTQDRSEFRFHINTLDDFRVHLKSNYLIGDSVQELYLPLPEVVNVSLPIFPQWIDREHQIPAIEYLLHEGPPVLKFIDIQTGQGKSYISMRAMSKRGVRTIIIVKPMYIEKWLKDIRKTYDIALEEVMVIQGSAHLMRMLQMADDGELGCKIILISNKTLQNWIKLYELHGNHILNMGYACLPEQLCAVTGAGIRLIDEVHQDFHLNFKIDLYTNVKSSISLSATMKADDDFVNNMYEVAYPGFLRYKGPAYIKYVNATAVFYRFKYPNKIRYKQAGTKAYNHHVLENSIIKHPEMFANYKALIRRILLGSFFKEYKAGQKCLLYCASVDLCTIMRDYLIKQFPDMIITRYVAEDPFENLMDADICVTTLGSAGTAVDIDNLTTVILSVALATSQGNIQSLGRLRQLKDGTTPEFIYLSCEDIPKHLEYHQQKRVILEEKALRYRSVFISEPI